MMVIVKCNYEEDDYGLVVEKVININLLLNVNVGLNFIF